MTANATRRSIRSLMRKVRRGDKLNILVFPTHERYEHNLCRTGHNFYSLNIGKYWERVYSEIPKNYYLIDSIPEYVDFDLILGHTSCERLEIAHDLLSETQKSPVNKLSIPVLRHAHILPDVRFDTEQQIQQYQSVPVDHTSFISKFNRDAWGFDESNSSVIEHGIDTDFWKPNLLECEGSPKTNGVCLSVVNDWYNRDWCCGFDLWKDTTQNLPVKVLGHNPGLSDPAESVEHLREAYRSSRIFYNTSLHSPVPTVLMEAMACGCAVVSTATCMIPEVIEHGKNGLMSNDPNELRTFLEMLLKDENLANKLGQEARKTICDKYNLQSFVDNWNNLLYDTVENYTDVMEVSNESISQPI